MLNNVKKFGFKPWRVSPKQFGLLPCSDICDNALRWVSRGAYKFRNMLICKNLHQTVNSWDLLTFFLGEITKVLIYKTRSFSINFYKKMLLILVVTGLVPPKKGRPPKRLGFRFCQVSFLSKKRWPVKSDQQASLNGLWFGLLCLQPSILNGALIFGEYFQYNILKALIQLQLVLWGLDDWTFETC